MRDQQTLGRAPGQPRRALLGRFAPEMPGRPPASGTMVQFGTVGPFDSRPHCSPKAGDLGFRRPAAGCTRPGGRLPLPSPPGLSGVGIDRASASTHVLAKALPHRRTDGRVPRGFQTQRSLAVLVVIVVGESGVEMALCRGSGGHCAPSRQAAEPTSLERDPGRGSDAEPRQRKGQFCPGRLAPSSRRSIPPRQSPFARHEPVCDRRRSDERPPGRTAGGRGWCPRFSRRSLCPIQISLSKHQRPRALRPASSPRCACGFRPGGERCKRRLWQGQAASCAEQSSVEKSTTLHTIRPHGFLLRACRNPAPLVGMCAARLMPGLAKPHPRGKTRARGSRLSRANERDQI